MLAYVWLGLAAPVVEIEHRGIRAAFARSVHLVRGRFWLVALVLIPIEIARRRADRLAHRPHPQPLRLGAAQPSGSRTLLANIAFTPFYAVAAVLLTVDLIREKGGAAELHSKPSP